MEIFWPQEPFRNPTLQFPDLTHGYLTKTSDGAVAPQTAFISIDRECGPGRRVFSEWSIGFAARNHPRSGSRS